MNYQSIVDPNLNESFSEAILKGIPPDGSLYVPETLPTINQDEIWSWKDLSFQELAKKLIRKFIPETEIPTADLNEIIDSSYKDFFSDQIIEHVKIGDQFVIQELFHGPTLSFKDMAMGFVVNLFEYLLKKQNKKANLFVATSGDTGPAAAFASIGKKHLNTFLLFPKGMISEDQRRQMTVLKEKNIFSVSIDCKNGSDDLDQIIFSLFENETYKENYHLSSVNSVNWARIMLQTVHYFYGYLQNAIAPGEKIHFSVPSGGFGNLCAGTIAKKMGLPVDKFIICCNKNATLTNCFNKGILTIHDIHPSYASAIDITIPMNFWRYLYFRLDEDTPLISNLFNEYKTNKKVRFPKAVLDKMQSDAYAIAIHDQEILQTIKDVYANQNYLLDPHGAVAWAGATQFATINNLIGS